MRIAANQETTREWWDSKRHLFETFISRFVINECADGDPVAAEERLEFLDGIAVLEMGDQVHELASALMSEVPLPMIAGIDAIHISVAAIHGVEFLLTWNCKHIANPSLRPRIERVCRQAGYEPPVICTPLELMEINDVQ